MCGIFGFISKDGHGPDLARMRRIAKTTETRGRHAFGLAWDRDGELGMYRRPGAASHRPADLEMAMGAQAVIGHCRWATYGDPEENANNHPHPAGRGWLMHNGTVGNYEELVIEHNLEIETSCDSEVLGLLMKRGRGSLLSRALYMRRQAQGTMATIGIWANPTRVLVLRSGRPLHFGQDDRGFYFASLHGGLPGKVRSLIDEHVYLMQFNEILEIDQKSIEYPWQSCVTA